MALLLRWGFVTNCRPKAPPCSLSSSLRPLLAVTTYVNAIRTFPLSCRSGTFLQMPLTSQMIELERTVMTEATRSVLVAVPTSGKDFDNYSIEQQAEPSTSQPSQKEVGAFQLLPKVASSSELLMSATRKAKMVRPTKGIANIAKRERNRGAKQLDALTKELAVPLRIYVEGFPKTHELHAYEHSLIDLTFGEGKYEEVLQKVNLFRKKILNIGKTCASLCAKATSKREAEELLKEGFNKVKELFEKSGNPIDDLVIVAKTLRRMPVVDLQIPTLCLVGAPNVGKSSLVRVLSTGKPEVCNYPFTTRSISMGHMFVDCAPYQVTDTPGLLRRPDGERNNMEKLTLAALSHLPTAVLFVHDLTSDCGTSISDQFKIYTEIKERFTCRPWLDVVSKADLLPDRPLPGVNIPLDVEELYRISGPAGAIHVSVQTGQGVDKV